MERRQFLQGLMASPLILGLSSFQDKTPGVDEGAKALKDGKALMKKRGQNGLVLVVPKDKKRRDELARFLFGLTQDGPFHDYQSGIEGLARHHQEYRETLCLATNCIFICLSPELAQKELKSQAERMVIDHKGKILRSLVTVPKSIEPGATKRLLDLVLGSKLEVLKAQAEAEKKALKPEQFKALEKELTAYKNFSNFGQEERRELLKKGDAVAKHSISAWLGLELMTVPMNKSRGLSYLLRARRTKLKVVPTGTILPKFRFEGCDCHSEMKPGEEAPANEGIECGMAMPSREGRRYLKFVTKK